MSTLEKFWNNAIAKKKKKSVYQIGLIIHQSLWLLDVTKP